MSIRIITETVCDRCGHLDKKENTSGRQPYNWAHIQINQRVIGNNDRLTAKTLCPNCTAIIEGILAG